MMLTLKCLAQFPRVQYLSHMVAEDAFEHAAELAEAQRQAAGVKAERTAEPDRQKMDGS